MPVRRSLTRLATSDRGKSLPWKPNRRSGENQEAGPIKISDGTLHGQSKKRRPSEENRRRLVPCPLPFGPQGAIATLAEVSYQDRDGAFDAPRGFAEGAPIVGQGVGDVQPRSIGFFATDSGTQARPELEQPLLIGTRLRERKLWI